MSYLNYLIITLLQNYKLTVDDNTMGLTVAAINFTNALKVILPGWNKTVRDNKSVSNHTPFITASKDSLTLLLNSPTYAIDAILQEDIVYILPSYI